MGAPSDSLSASVAQSPFIVAQRLSFASAFGMPVAVVQRKPPDDKNVFTYEDSEGLVWSRDEHDQWYRPGDKPGEKIYWAEDNGKAKAEAVSLPNAPASASGSGDGFRQNWVMGGITYVFSSGHGYRPNHHKSGQPPSKNITELGTMNEIELAILADFNGSGGMPEVGKSGTRPIVVSGEAVEYRFSRFAADRIGIGTYYRPD